MLDMAELYGERETYLQALEDAIQFKKKIGRRLAVAERDYKVARTKLMAEMMIVGYTTPNGKTKSIAATAVYDLAQGDEVVAELKLKRDMCAADDSVTQERIYQLKLQINILSTDIENVRRIV